MERISCGSVSEKLLGTKVKLSGWVNKRRDHGGLVFVDLRDRSGIVQLVLNPDVSKEVHEIAHALRPEFVVEVEGEVVARSKETINSNIPTGKIEIKVEKVKILNKAKTLPFMLDEAKNVEEELRLKYRYLDIRRPEILSKLALRHKIIFEIRKFLNNQSFY